MALMNLWRSSPETIKAYAIRQIVAVAGDGRLRDASECSQDLRAYLHETPSDRIAAYVSECLQESFEDSGFVLQDVINEIGRRLEFQVEDGRYRGKQGLVGFDGIWRAGEDLAIIVEVKTTDTYNARLDDVAAYREALIQQGRVPEQASTLFVVGRKDTGALEAQIRGSRYAWDMRVVGADSLVKLVHIKEKSSEDSTVRQIRELLRPFEYTRIDRIVDVVFDTASDVEKASEEPQASEASEYVSESPGTTAHTRTSPTALDAMRDRIVSAMQAKLGVPLVRRRRALFETSDNQVRASISISKRYDRDYQPYWYAFHPKWRSFLDAAPKGLVVLGCMDRREAFAIPLETFADMLQKLNQTKKDDGTAYWHVVITTQNDGSLALYSSRTGEAMPLAPFRLELEV